MTAIASKAGGLVDVSRATYQRTPLAVTEIRPKVFDFVGAGGTVTAVGGSQGSAIIDTGYGSRMDEIRSAIAWRLGNRRAGWLIHIGTSTIRTETRLSQKIDLETNMSRLSNGGSPPRHAPHGPD
jgi:hypothetical protein